MKQDYGKGKMHSLSNRRILEKNSGMLVCGEPDHPYNNAVREDMRRDEDYSVVTKEQWRFLEGNYVVETVPTVMRVMEKTGYGIRTAIELFYVKVSFGFGVDMEV